MPSKHKHTIDTSAFRSELIDHNQDLGELAGWMFEGLLIYFDGLTSQNAASLTYQDAGFKVKQAYDTARFAGARSTDQLWEGTTHVLIGNDRSRYKILRQNVSTFQRLPRFVTHEWVEQSWAEKTLLDEERELVRSLRMKIEADDHIRICPNLGPPDERYRSA